MKKNLLFLLIILIITASIKINYAFNNSLIEQTILVYEFNNSGSLDYPFDKVQNFNHTFPNVTVTALPISFMKARYYLKAKKFDEALALIYESMKINPYIGVSEFELAKFYQSRNSDSLYNNSKQAFHKLPSNSYHSKFYFYALSKLNREQELDSAFNIIKKNNDFEQWKDYIFYKLALDETNRMEMTKLLEGNSTFDQKKDQYVTLRTLVDIGFNNYSSYEASIIKAENLFDQGRLIEAAIIYDEVSVKNPSQYLLKENAAIVYFKAGMTEAAINSFQFVIDNYIDRKDAKSEFYLGLTYLLQKNKSLGCTYLKYADDKDFAGSKKVMEKYCN
tara:strand:+ start:231 stop:1232 length:1002 start_codon:yes stop_codon:yes gene_type:complete